MPAVADSSTLLLYRSEHNPISTIHQEVGNLVHKLTESLINHIIEEC